MRNAITNVLLSLMIIMLTVFSLNLFHLGMDYINADIGHGVHPLFAFPVATIVLLFTLAFPNLIRTRHD